jgi:RNA recognition motif-containing protein
METKLYVGNLPYTTTEDDLRVLFTKAGEVASAVLIKDRDTGRSRGFGFVEMASQADAENAIRMFNAYNYNDRELVVNLARPREERRGGSGRPSEGRWGDQERRAPRERRDRDRRGPRGY